MSAITPEYKTQVSIRYHRKREHFFRIMDSLGKGISVLAIASFGASKISVLFAAVVGVISVSFTIISLVLDFSGMASKHSALAQRFIDLLARIQSGSLEQAEQVAQFHLIAKDEPPALRGLGQLCQDEQDAAEGKNVKPECLSMRRRLAAQFGFGQRPIDFEHSESTA
ncbi:hypothetical protein [Achromobacter marplatensis]|uniref:hypothetical protein n=1 Tax=Achromobacter marplatensis TaxID=470868 RepID=UPI001178871E|nr:hypothetical protein [Achromobacter marplatensis]